MLTLARFIPPRTRARTVARSELAGPNVQTTFVRSIGGRVARGGTREVGLGIVARRRSVGNTPAGTPRGGVEDAITFDLRAARNRIRQPSKPMSHIHVKSAEQADGLIRDLAGAERFALDCEAAGFHRYSDRLCLLQLTVGERTYVIDPLAFDPSGILREPIERPDVGVIMHGADFDLRLLSRDLGIRLRGLLDTQVCAALLGEEGLGLQALLESRLGVTLSKKYQRADWANRPLSEEMLEYAASDTRHLEELVRMLAEDLERMGRLEWAEEECLALEAVSDGADDEEPDDDPVTRVKGARDLTDRQVTALREALLWRDEIARTRDRATFRVIGDRPLIDAVARHPTRVQELLDIRGFPSRLAREEGKELIRRLGDVAKRPTAELRPYPRNANRGPARPPPEVEARFQRLKEVRNQVAHEIGLPRGTILSNAVLTEIARLRPTDRDELLAVEGMRRWKADVFGGRLVDEVARS